jgi:hypothetical protein
MFIKGIPSDVGCLSHPLVSPLREVKFDKKLFSLAWAQRRCHRIETDTALAPLSNFNAENRTEREKKLNFKPELHTQAESKQTQRPESSDIFQGAPSGILQPRALLVMTARVLPFIPHNSNFFLS